MRIAFITAELAPFAQVGGLADVSRWLPATLSDGGDDVRVFVPRYDVLDPHGLELRPVPAAAELDLGPLGTASLLELRGAGPVVYLVDAPQWFGRGGMYAPGDDEHLRYGALCRAAVAAAPVLGWMPDVVHANDWHTALFPLHADAAGPPWSEVPVVFTIHNLAYQGWFPGADLAKLDLDPRHPAIAPSDRASGGVNSLRTGLRAAELVTTVSPTYATEIITPELGMGLDDTLRELGDRLVGILNGVGPEWDPSTDQRIAARYDADRLARKHENTAALRDRLGLDHRNQVPVMGVVSRMDLQKGFGMFPEVLPDLLGEGRAQLAVIGTGDPALEAMFAGFAERFPGEAGYHRGFDADLAHLIEAGSHIFLMPSRFEPCGLNQMYSLRYGTVPVVHRTGGLADSVDQWDPGTLTGTGFLFDEFAADAFAGALEAAISAFGDHAAWERLQRNGMAEDFSWQRRAAEYREVYRRAAAR